MNTASEGWWMVATTVQPCSVMCFTSLIKESDILESKPLVGSSNSSSEGFPNNDRATWCVSAHLLRCHVQGRATQPPCSHTSWDSAFRWRFPPLQVEWIAPPASLSLSPSLSLYLSIHPSIHPSIHLSIFFLGSGLPPANIWTGGFSPHLFADNWNIEPGFYNPALNSHPWKVVYMTSMRCQMDMPTQKLHYPIYFFIHLLAAVFLGDLGQNEGSCECQVFPRR